MDTVRITAPDNGLTRGTKVFTPSGQEVPMITGITIYGAVDDVWRAKIECMASFAEIKAIPEFDMKGIKEQIVREMLKDPAFSDTRKTDLQDYLERLNGD